MAAVEAVLAAPGSDDDSTSDAGARPEPAGAPATSAAGPPTDAAEAQLSGVFVCDYCCVETQQALAARLVHTIATRATMHKTTVDITIAKLREKLLPPPSGKKAPTPSLTTLLSALNTAEDVKAKGLAFFTSKEEMHRRVAIFEREMEMTWRHAHRDQLAAELLRVYDPERENHCGVCIGAGMDGAVQSPASASACERHRISCIFRPVACRNEGCVALYSARAESAHDGTCLFKVLPCVRGCDARVTRQEMNTHVDGPCVNRPVDCPYAMIGCTHPCTVGTVDAHTRDAVTEHLALSLAVITAQQRCLNELTAANVAMTTAAAELTALRGRVDALESGADDAKKAAKAVEAERDKQRAKDNKRIDETMSKLSKAKDTLEKENREAHAKAQKEAAELRKALDGLTARLQ